MANDGQTRSHVIVTGGSSGIGAAAVEGLRDRDANVTVFDLAPPIRTDLGFF